MNRTKPGAHKLPAQGCRGFPPVRGFGRVCKDVSELIPHLEGLQHGMKVVNRHGGDAGPSRVVMEA